MFSNAEHRNWFSDLRCYQAIQHSLAGRHDHIAQAYRHQWPNFLIIGAAKSATTTLATVLGQHPEIHISSSMEPKFLGRNYRRGWEWYGRQFSGGEHCRLRGEASTMYTSTYRSYQHTPQLIHHHFGTIPLIYLVRHPLRRIESHWRHWQGRVHHCPPFHQLLESKSLKQRVVEASLYHRQYKRYRRWFPASSIHCLSTEALTTHPQEKLKDILVFLGLSSHNSKLLPQGQLPLTNSAGSKGRRSISPPEWPEELKKKTIELIRPDSEHFLEELQWPKSTWEWE
jgi:hypothetical protein